MATKVLIEWNELTSKITDHETLLNSNKYYLLKMLSTQDSNLSLKMHVKQHK